MCESKVLIEWCGYSRSIFLKTRADFRESILYRYICCSVLCNVPCAIVKKDFALYVFAVAPLAGAWVEINQELPYARKLESLPLRERGLKFTIVRIIRGLI